MAPSETVSPFISNFKMIPFNNHTTLDKAAASILSVSAPVK
ncbi:6944_t:CDS:1, partial [Racocetra fulgida]